MARFVGAIALVLLAFRPGAGSQVPATTVEPAPSFDRLVERLEQALLAGTPAAYLALVDPSADRSSASAFAEAQFVSGATRVVFRLRDHGALTRAPAGNYRLILEVFVETGRRGRIATWRVDVHRHDPHPQNATGWGIVDQEQLTAVFGLYRLALDETQQFAARNLSITAEDLVLTLERGSVFFARIEEGVTALVLLGRGRMRFAPTPEAERGQVKIFSGGEVLDTDFDRAFVRINPFQFEERVSEASLREQAVDPRMLRRARAAFDELANRSYSLELGDFSPHAWSLVPNFGDFVAEIDTSRYDTLTYARSQSEAEDVTLFDREDKRNIALYASQQKLDRRGVYYDENELVDYDVLHYSVDVSFYPAREHVEGRARLTLRVRSFALATITLKLAAALAVREVRSDEFGRLLHLRVRGQEHLIVGLPTTLGRGDQTTIEVAYGGQLPPQSMDREALAVHEPRGAFIQDPPLVAPEPSYLYSNRSYWYPQSTVTDYATARLRATVPDPYAVVASGEPTPDSPTTIAREDGTKLKEYVFLVSQPARYLSCVISRFHPTEPRQVAILTEGDGTNGEPAVASNTAVAGVVYDTVSLAVEANPRQVSRAGSLAERAAEIMRFYASIVGDYPYPSFTLALSENQTPGGHSPPYFAILHQPVPTRPFTWRNDPVSFEGFDSFYLAHEVAHQWWGQAVGWKNYHEQWLSEGFAQYFAALYGLHEHGNRLFLDILQQMRRTSIQHADQGPIYLGYRLGHIKGEGRVFRALIYNKAAMVLHMLRRLIGDPAFFQGLRQFYAEWRFKKAGTADVRRAFEQAAGRPLERFFQRWIHDSAIPRLTFSHRVEPGSELTDGEDAAASYVWLRFEQEGEPLEMPVTATLDYQSGESQHVIVPVTDEVTEVRLPLLGDLRQVDVNRDYAALAEIDQ